VSTISGENLMKLVQQKWLGLTQIVGVESAGWACG
jgi:hypothetical protein